jgi:glucose/arabinose dehydrogenase/cytochrome c553
MPNTSPLANRLAIRLALVLALAGTAAAQGQSASSMWTNDCASCHGGRGEGSKDAKTLLTDDKFDQTLDRPFFDAIKAGKDKHAFGSKFKNEQIWSLVVHIRELQRDERRSRLGSPKAEGGVYSSKYEKYKVETVVENSKDSKVKLRTPWSCAFITGPLEGMLVTNRSGEVLLFREGKLINIDGVPESVEAGQGGMMDVETHPDFAKNGWIYLAYADPSPTQRNRNMTRVVRGKLKAEGDKVVWTDQQDIFQAKPEHYVGSGLHFGVKIAFDPKDSSILYFGIGERGNGQLAQDLKRPNGKIFRVKDDGTIPADNPFVNEKDAYPAIWSYGHRNPQGLHFDAAGNLWDTEHGPRGGDELNLIQKGGNYGWPIVTFGINYQDTPLRTPWVDVPESRSEGQSLPANIIMPTYRWLPSIAACGLGLSNGSAFPKWKGDLFAGGLAGANVDRVRVKVEGGKGVFVEREEIIHGMGRVRDVTEGPNGDLYVVLNEPDRVLKITPAK